MPSVAVVADSRHHKPSLVRLVEGSLGPLKPFLSQQQQLVNIEHGRTSSNMPHKVVDLLRQLHKPVAHNTVVVVVVAVVHLAYNFDSRMYCLICMQNMSQRW